MENRLVAVTKGTHRSEFEYDPLGRRSRIVEKDADGQGGWTTGSDKRYLWEGAEIVEEEAADGSTLKAFYGQGFVDTDGTALFYTRDHLGSVRELVDATGAVRARYDYDPYVRVTKVSGDRDSLFLYTGHLWHGQSGLFLTLFRAYDPALGRWISRDPKQEGGGINLYAYVADNPINLVDPLGLSWRSFGRGIVKGVAIAAAIALIPIEIPAAVIVTLAVLASIGLAKALLDPCISADRKHEMLGMVIGGGAFGGFAGGGEAAVENEAADIIETAIEAGAEEGMAEAMAEAEAEAVGSNPIWSSTKKLSSTENAYKHWEKHGSEFPSMNNAVDYAKGANEFVSNPPPGTLIGSRGSDTVLYHPQSNTFAVANSEGVPKTMFRPNPAEHGYSSNMEYFWSQFGY